MASVWLIEHIRKQAMYEFKHSVFKRHRNPDTLNENQRQLWEERVAICMIDGGVTQQRAEQLAWEQMDREVKTENLIFKGVS